MVKTVISNRKVCLKMYPLNNLLKMILIQMKKTIEIMTILMKTKETEMMTKMSADATGDEPDIKPCSAEAHVQRMSKLCQNQKTSCIQAARKTNEVTPMVRSFFLPYLSASQPSGRANSKAGMPSRKPW